MKQVANTMHTIEKDVSSSYTEDRTLREELDVWLVGETSDLLLAEAFKEYCPLEMMRAGGLQILEVEYFHGVHRRRAIQQTKERQEYNEGKGWRWKKKIAKPGIEVRYMIVMPNYYSKFSDTVQKCRDAWKDYQAGYTAALQTLIPVTTEEEVA